MESQETSLKCKKCNTVWNMSKYGRLEHEGNSTHIPDWYEWERKNVQKEIDEKKYKLKCRVHIVR